jgi:hypothetical protein
VHSHTLLQQLLEAWTAGGQLMVSSALLTNQKLGRLWRMTVLRINDLLDHHT